MGFFRRIEDFFQRPQANTITFDEAEKALRWKKLQEDLGAFTFSEEGFTYQTADELLSIKWIDVIRVISFKRDLFTYDLICLQLFWPGGDVLFQKVRKKDFAKAYKGLIQAFAKFFQPRCQNARLISFRSPDHDIPARC